MSEPTTKAPPPAGGDDIDTTSHRPSALSEALPRLVPALGPIAFLTLMLLLFAAPALAGQAAVGEALFFPCTSCHPIEAGKRLPNGFDGHSIELVGHDKLGPGSQACLVCHEDPGKDPGKLKRIDGTLVGIEGDVSAVCYRCHSDKHGEWAAGIHGKGMPKCTSSGCHDPHTPGWIYSDPLPPFVGTGFQARAVSNRVPFTPLAPAPEAPATETPAWFLLAVGLGLTTAGATTAFLIRGGLKR